MKLEHVKRILIQHKKELKKNYNIKEIGIFGSYVKGEQKEKSDLDVLVEFLKDSNMSLLEFIKLQNLLSDMLGIRIDLVEKKCLKPHIGKRILEEVIYL